MTAPENNKGLRRIYNAFFFSVHGIKACFRTEEAFRQEIYLSCLLIPAGLYFGETSIEKLLLVGSVLFVLLVEILNTAIERAIDRISFEKHELSKEAKDMGSAAVLISLLMCGLIWGFVLFA